MKPYFEVGEEVILCSEECPQFNGDAVVIMIVEHAVFIDPHNGLVVRILGYSGDIFYILDGYVDDAEQDGRSNYWDQSSLRKKHQPGKQSFNKLMSGIKQPA